VGTRDVLGSGGGFWDASASHLGLRDVSDGVMAHRDAFEGGGRVLGTSWAPETCLGVGAGSGMHQPCVWDCETSVMVLWLTKMCLRVEEGLGHIVGTRDVFGSGGGFWDASASRLGLRDVSDGVVAHRDAFEGGGRVLGTSWAPET
jgi:hypothetical protein